MGACSCDDDSLTSVGPNACEPDFECPQGEAYRLGECRVARCQDDRDCCPGQLCSTAVGICVSQWTQCTGDSECVLPGQRCIDFRGGEFCGYPNRAEAPNSAGTQACAETQDCPIGTTCVGARCLLAAPCEGGCPSGQACDIDSNTCFALDTCTQTCGESELAVISDPDVMSGDTCCAVECACVTLPPVRAGQFGWHASLAADPDGAWVAAWDAEFGDLVVARYDASGAFQSVEYVDGFPSQGPVAADPNGPRGGRNGPGPDVGEYASLAMDNGGGLHIAYYDRSESRLKYARRDGDTWTTHVIDDDGDVGRFTALRIGPDGRPRTSYMVVDAEDPSGGRYSGVRFAEARRPLPNSSADWTVVEVDRRSLTEEDEADEADDLPRGTGLFTSLVLTSTGTPLIAYYDREAGDLRLATGTGAGRFMLRSVDGANADVGAHVSAALGPGERLGLAYMDLTRDDLVYLEPSTGLREVIDDGVSPPDLRMIGADASLLFDASGQPSVAYQDATRLDLMWARRSGPGTWSPIAIRGAAANPSEAAAGFYATQDYAAGRTFIGSVAVGFDAEANLQLRLTVDVRR